MQIETFAFFDIETTGLPQYERNRTKITEATFIAVSRRDMEESDSPPLMNKLSFVFNPEKTIQTEASRLTGLTNMKLKNQPIFKDRIQSINTFLTELPKPVCIVAHNGNRFDFKILKAEYSDAGKNLPNDLFCLDSLMGFKRIIQDKTDDFCSKDISDGESSFLKSNKSNITVISDELLTDDDDDEWPPLNTSTEEWEEIDKLSKSFSNLSSGEDDEVSKTKEKVCLKLSALYKRFLNTEAVESHRAEADCLMLLSCVAATQKYFLPWADRHCKPISEILPLVRR